jgi:hypothetical protein
MPVAAELGKPLWGAELNTASAEAVTVPPLGRPHPGPWETAFKQAGAQAVPVPPPQSVEGPALAAQVPQPAAEPSPEPAPAARLADS